MRFTQNVVIVREDSPGDTRLVTYFVTRPDENVDANQLRQHLRKSLPYYMVPQHFVQLDAMPQTNNGKIDYKALPAPGAEAVETDSDQPSPETPAEIYLAGVWSEILDGDDVGLNDTFFDVGGHSLLVMKVISQVNEKTGVKLGPQDFLMCTLQQLAEKLDDSNAFENQPHSKSNQDKATKASVAEAHSSSAVEAAAKLVAEVNSSKNKKAGLIEKLKGFWD